MKEFKITINDLKEDVQVELIEFLGGNGNYDIVPIAVIGAPEAGLINEDAMAN